MRRVVVAVLVAGCLGPVRPSPEARRSGRVVDSDGQPVAGAEVHLGTHVTTSGADGSFAFAGVASGRAWAIEGDRWGETIAGSTIRLRRGETMVVHVVDETGAPIAGATLSDPRHRVVTGADGSATIRGLADRPLGTAEAIDVRAPGRGLATIPWPRSEATVRLDRGAAMTGIVVDPSGAPVGDAEVVVQTAKSFGRDRTRTDAAGRFRFDALAAGPAYLHASSSRFGDSPELRIDLDGTHETTAGTLRLALAPEVTIVVRDPSGRPAAGAELVMVSEARTTVRIADDRGVLAWHSAPGPIEVYARRDDLASPVSQIIVRDRELHTELALAASSTIAGIVVDRHGTPIANAHVMIPEHEIDPVATDAAGRFELVAVPPGAYDVLAAGGSVKVPTGTRDARIAKVEPGRIIARVSLDGRPVPFQYSVSPDIHPSTPRDGPADGNLVIDLHAGTWKLVMFGRDFARKTVTHIAVRSGETTNLGELELGPGITITRRVTANGRPVAGAKVAFDDMDFFMYEPPITAITDIDGRYTLTHIARGGGGHVIASHPDHGETFPHGAGQVDETIDLGFLPTGDLDGVIDGEISPRVYAHFDGEPRMSRWADVGNDGRFHLALPEGDYGVSPDFRGSSGFRNDTHVRVVAGRRSSVRIYSPPTVVLIAVAPARCRTAMLMHEGQLRAWGMCLDRDIRFEHVPAGSYEICIEDHCSPVIVQPTPATQTATLAPAG
jgi:protocatechuate 3,4-dioxygenase beta subunit